MELQHPTMRAGARMHPVQPLPQRRVQVAAQIGRHPMRSQHLQAISAGLSDKAGDVLLTDVYQGSTIFPYESEGLASGEAPV